MPLPRPEDFPVQIIQVGVSPSDRAAVDADYAPKPQLVVAKPPKAKVHVNGHSAVASEFILGIKLIDRTQPTAVPRSGGPVEELRTV